MAEVSQQGGGGKPKSGKPKQKKSSTKIDMTPMVDLAFLLLTFFMLTTSFSKPKTMPVIMPEKDKTENPDPPDKINVKDVLHVILGKENRIFYYMGLEDQNPEVKQASWSPTAPNSIRKVLHDEQEKNWIERAGQDRKNFRFTVLIKPVDASRYKNIVDIFDEMNIVNVRSYALVDISPAELEMVKELDAKAEENK